MKRTPAAIVRSLAGLGLGLLLSLGASAQLTVTLQVDVDRQVLAVGDTVQLQVFAVGPTDTSDDLSGVSATTYSAVDPGVVSVTATGQVTALAPGQTTVVVRNEEEDPAGPISATVSFRVFAESDRDSDGIPNDYELAHGFDPDDPNDAAADTDEDGLTNRQEFLLGSDPRKADTDGDEISDGLEASRGTDPLNPLSPFPAPVQLLDSSCLATVLNRTTQVSMDGGFAIGNVPLPQGVFRVRFLCTRGAGIERLQSGFLVGLPNDSTPLGVISISPQASIAVSLQITAPAPTLIGSGSSGQVMTRGLLEDGTEVDLTPASTGTSYQSSNPAIASVSAEGLVTAVSSGTVFVTATNEGVAGTIRLQVQITNDTDGDGLPDDYEARNAVNPGGANLALLPGTLATASSEFSPASLAIDGDRATYWQATDDTGFIELTLPSDSGVAQVRLLGAGPAVGSPFEIGKVQAFDAAGSEIFSSGSRSFPTPGGDLAVPVDRDGVHRIRFTVETNGVPTLRSRVTVSPPGGGLAEFQVIASPGGAGFDAHDPGDAAADFDHDGRTNLQEFAAGTNPFSSDSDGDGLSDSEEIPRGTQPLVADTDGDGLTDGQEIVFHTDPLNPDSDGDGLPDGVEVRLNLDPLLVDSDGNGSDDGSEDSDFDGLPNGEEVLEHTDPGNPDTDGDGILDGSDPDPLRPDRTPPLVALTTPTTGDALFEGQTLDLLAEASDDGQVQQVDFLVNGQLLGSASSSEPPYTLRLTIPYALSQLTIEARAIDSAGNATTTPAALFTVVPSTATADVHGTLVDSSGNPLPGAAVSLRLHGLQGEFFDFTEPFTDFPDLTGLTPDPTKLVSGLSFRNPADTLSPDTFGVGLAPDFAGRFTGMFQAPSSGLFDIRLGTTDGARLSIDGIPLLEIVSDGTFAETGSTFSLSGNPIPIEIDTFHNQSPGELTLGFTRSDSNDHSEQGELLQNPSLYSSTTGADGSYTFSGVPVLLGDVAADFSLTQGGLLRKIQSATMPLAGDNGEVDLGTTVLPATSCIKGSLSYSRCLSGPVSHPLVLLGSDGRGGQTPLGTVTPDGDGNFCATLPREWSFYVLREEDVTCQDIVSTCETNLGSADPEPGDCGDPATCVDLGDLNLRCNFFGGS